MANIEKIMTWRAFLQALLMIQKPTTCDDARDRRIEAAGAE
jgi:hypothetical protein